MSYDISSSLTYFTQYQSLGPSILLQMAVFHAFNGWVVFHCMCVYICVCVCVVYIHIYTPHLLYPFLCQWTGRLLPRLGCCKQCCGEHWVACIFSNYVFLQIYAQEVFVHCVLYILYINKVCAYTHTHTRTHPFSQENWLLSIYPCITTIPTCLVLSGNEEHLQLCYLWSSSIAFSSLSGIACDSLIFPYWFYILCLRCAHLGTW